MHPKESIFLLRGSGAPDGIVVEELVVPPFATYGQGFAAFPFHLLPLDFSIVGTAHSHPSGVAAPSLEDLNHMYGKLLLIVAYPYADERNMAVFNRSGMQLPLRIQASGDQPERGARDVD